MSRTKKINHTAVETRAQRATAAREAAQAAHDEATSALAAAEAAQRQARDDVAQGTAGGEALSTTAATVEAAQLRASATAAALGEATKIETAAVAEHHAVQLAGTMGSVIGAAELREQIAAAVVPAITAAAESVLARNAVVAEATAHARRAGLREEHIDPFAPVAISSAGTLIVHGHGVSALDPEQAVLPAARAGIAAALAEVGITAPGDVLPRASVSTSTVGREVRDEVLALAVATLTEGLPGVAVEAVEENQIVSVPELEPGQTVIRVGRARVQQGSGGYSGSGLVGSVTIAVYQDGEDGKPGAALADLPTRDRAHSSSTGFRLDKTYTSAGSFFRADAHAGERVILGGVVCDTVRLEMRNINTSATEAPPAPAPRKARSGSGVYAPSNGREFAPGHVVHEIDYDPQR